MTGPSAKQKLLALFRAAAAQGTLVKLTLGASRSADATLKNVFVRPVALRAGPRLAFLYRHTTRDITKNLGHDEGMAHVAELLDQDFQCAHLFTTKETAELQLRPGQPPRLALGKPSHAAPPSADHDRRKPRLIDAKGSVWLHPLGVTTADGAVRDGMAAKFRQINRFVEILQHLLSEWPRATRRGLSLVDMGCGKGYLTFAAFDHLRRSGWAPVQVLGLEAREDLVKLCNGIAHDHGCDGLRFACGTIDRAALEGVDVLVALHACDTATDDAIAKGIQAGVALIVVAPCCHKELRPQLRPPPPLAGALRHGILRERQAEFVTDALRAALLDWAGYDTKVFEFISAEHTAKNLMIAATKRERCGCRDARERAVKNLAAFYGIKIQRLAQQLGMALESTPGQES